jgi:hypothetical protein
MSYRLHLVAMIRGSFTEFCFPNLFPIARETANEHVWGGPYTVPVA